MMDIQTRPWVAARGSAVIGMNNRNQVVLVKRLGRPLVGIWTTPMGHIEPNEDPEHAAAREFSEETGLSVNIVRQLHHFKNGTEDIELLLYLGRVDGDGIPVGADDVEDARFFSLDDLPLDQADKLDFPASETFALRIHEKIMEYASTLMGSGLG